MEKMKEPAHSFNRSSKVAKRPTGIEGFDDITNGGLPAGRPTLVCGGAGCGKTVFGMEFLVRGAEQFDEPGVFMAFEETEKDLAENFSSLGFDLEALVDEGKIAIDHVFVERSEIEETGDYDLEGLFIRLDMAINQVNAKRVVLDTIESLFSGFSNEAVLRAELRRLFRWLKEKGVTAVITAEQGTNTFSRHGLEEYVADCVIVLDHRVEDQISVRRLRIVKYRGSDHGPDEYPFLIDRGGLSLIPVSSLGLDHPASTERLSTGVPALDEMFDGKGYYRGGTVLISGAAGTGKTSFAAHFVHSACARGERAVYISFEESPDQITRNMNSIGVDLKKWVGKGLLKFHALRPTFYGLESHLRGIHRVVEGFQPSIVAIDPISNLALTDDSAESKSMLMRTVDFLKSAGVTVFCTGLTSGDRSAHATDAGISSLTDTWIVLRSLEVNEELRHTLYIAKSRGMKHSKRVREFEFTDRGLAFTEGTGGRAQS